MIARTSVLIGLLAFALNGAALAQEDSAPAKAATAGSARSEKVARSEGAAERAQPDRPTATLRVQLVISRFQGERKTGSLPYAFTVTATVAPGGSRTRMRMGVDTPVPVFTMQGGEGQPNHAVPTSYQYKNVGTNIDCFARDLGDGRYLLNMTVENSSTLTGSEREIDAATTTRPPLFRRFETSLDPVLRDGQSLQTVASTDPVTGEVVKIDVTMNVVK
ncbi:MAG TPA: hypothetical protein VMX54_20420 [Vicinamibacteria bacterium]|nr:hypothetical protein [Vicinamibacteria bacterium]